MASRTSTLKCAAVLVTGTLLMICLFATGAAAANGDANNPANPPPAGANPPKPSKDHVPGKLPFSEQNRLHMQMHKWEHFCVQPDYQRP